LSARIWISQLAFWEIFRQEQDKIAITTRVGIKKPALPPKKKHLKTKKTPASGFLRVFLKVTALSRDLQFQKVVK
jgi:hypothetical protein